LEWRPRNIEELSKMIYKIWKEENK
jgi:hypothetical protein